MKIPELDIGHLLKGLSHGSVTKDGKTIRFFDPTDPAYVIRPPPEVEEHVRAYMHGAILFLEGIEDSRGWDSFNVYLTSECHFRSTSHVWMNMKIEAWREGHEGETDKRDSGQFQVEIQVPWQSPGAFHILGMDASRAFIEVIAGSNQPRDES